MSADSPLNQHKRHSDEYLAVILSGNMTNEDVLAVTSGFNEEDFAGYWQAKRIHKAIKTAAETAIANGLGEDTLSKTDVQHQLQEQSEFTNNRFSQAWLDLIGTDVLPQSPAKLPELQRRIVESHFRIVHNDTYKGDTAFTHSIDDLSASMAKSREKLLSIYARMATTTKPTMSIVAEGAA